MGKEILSLKLNFETVTTGKTNLNMELRHIHNNARTHCTARNRQNWRLLNSNSWSQRKNKAKKHIKKSLAAEEKAARYNKAMQEKIRQLKTKVAEKSAQ